MTRVSSSTAFAALLAPALAFSQQRPAQASSPNAKDVLQTVKWRSLGPANPGGRIPAIAGVPGEPNIYYVGSANGGIIRTKNGGTTFESIFDKQTSISIGAIAVAPSDKNIIYVGTGEGNPRNNASIGDGMYKSIDGGDNWTKIGLEKSDKITRIVIDAKNPDIVYSCVLGREWGPSEERGVFKTVDGGKSWRRVLFVDTQTACSDISANADNSNVIYAGMYTYRRWAWHLESGGGQTAVWKSVNGGDTWERLSGPDKMRGLPKKAMDRIGVAVAPSDPNIVYVLTETVDEGELWRSDDGGNRWAMVNRDPNINFRPFYYADIRVDPVNPNKAFALSGGLYMTEDGGRTFRSIARDVHGDHQSMWIDPKDPNRVLSGSDGGWQLSYDGGRNFDIVNTFPFTQFYHINYDMQKPYYVCGGLQDNGSWCGPSFALSGQGHKKSDWYTVSGGDGFFSVPNLAKPWLIYSTSQGGYINLTDTRSGVQKTIYPYPNRVGSVGDAMIGHKYRYNWNPPVALSPQNPGVVYFAGNVLFKSKDHGYTWDVISPDLTTNDPKKQQSSGGPIVVDNTAAEFHSTILSIAPSPLDSNVVWVSTDDGNVQVTRDGGKTWSNTFTNVPGLKPNAWLATIEASNFEVGTAYVAADHHQDDDYSPLAYMTTDFGKTWKSIIGDLPASAAWVHVVREDKRNKNLIYIGTEMGVWASWNRGVNWSSLRGDLPVVQVRDMQIHPRENDLILGTHGRGLYILDDLTALQQLPEAAAAGSMLFDIRPTIRWHLWSKDGNQGQRTWTGENPPNGALISYYLKAEPRGAVDITISDANNRVIRRMNRASDLAGVNRVVWDLRIDGAPGGGGGFGGGGGGGAGAGGPPDTSLAGLRERRRAAAAAGTPIIDGVGGGGGFGGGGGGGGGGAPFALPGTYTVAVRVDGATLTKTVQVSNDPRAETTQAQLVASFDAAMKLREVAASVNRIIANVDDLLRQTAALREQLRSVRGPLGGTNGGAAASPQAVIAQIDSTQRDLRHFRDSVLARPVAGLGYRQYPRLREEVNVVTGMVSRPLPLTAGETLRMGELGQETTQAQARLDFIIQNRVTKINGMLAGAQHILVPRPAIVP
jgi:photosystem II stability/assembly factor-like uncharacterized protein